MKRPAPLVLRNGANLDSKACEVPAGTRIVVLKRPTARMAPAVLTEFQSTMENDDKGAILLNGWVTSVLADGTENFKEEEAGAPTATRHSPRSQPPSLLQLLP